MNIPGNARERTVWDGIDTTALMQAMAALPLPLPNMLVARREVAELHDEHIARENRRRNRRKHH